MILVVEDSVRFYSSVLPHIYKNLLKQSYESSTEALNEHEQMLRMRGRPKVMLARNYEEAMEIYSRYGQNLLGVISDVSFNRNGEKDKHAGFKLAEELRKENPYLPIILESSESENEAKAKEIDCVFIDKNSKKFPVDLSAAITQQFSFGDFVMTDPETGKEIRIRSLKAPPVSHLRHTRFGTAPPCFVKRHLTMALFTRAFPYSRRHKGTPFLLY